MMRGQGEIYLAEAEVQILLTIVHVMNPAGPSAATLLPPPPSRQVLF